MKMKDMMERCSMWNKDIERFNSFICKNGYVETHIFPNNKKTIKTLSDEFGSIKILIKIKDIGYPLRTDNDASFLKDITLVITENSFKIKLSYLELMNFISFKTLYNYSRKIQEKRFCNHQKSIIKSTLEEEFNKDMLNKDISYILSPITIQELYLKKRTNSTSFNRFLFSLVKENNEARAYVQNEVIANLMFSDNDNKDLLYEFIDEWNKHLHVNICKLKNDPNKIVRKYVYNLYLNACACLDDDYVNVFFNNKISYNDFLKDYKCLYNIK